MLKTIANVSPQLVAFVLAIQLSLSRPQVRHVTQVADAHARRLLEEARLQRLGEKLTGLPPKARLLCSPSVNKPYTMVTELG